MIKYLFVTFNSIALFFYSLFLDNGSVTVTGNFPANIKPGTEVTAELTVKKGSSGGFAKLQVEVPEGFIIKESDSKGGNFSFAGGLAKWIWTATPSESEFTIKFKLSVDATVSGNKTIAAKYSFIENNNKLIAEMTPVSIIVGEEEGAVATNDTKEKEQPVNNTNTNTASNTSTTTPDYPIASENQEPNSLVSAQRTITKGTQANQWIIDVKIKKDGIKGFARYSDNLPTGFSAKQLKTQGGSFSVADNRIKFVWVNVPAAEDINVSYILTGVQKDDTALEGEFSYLENNQSKTYKVAAEKLPLNAESEVAINNETKTNENTIGNQNTTTETKTTTTTSSENNTTVTSNEKPAEKTSSSISYAIQIGAFANANVKTATLASLYGIGEKIRSEFDSGLSKFLVGKFSEYSGARNHREAIKSKVEGAFVTAYNGPKRITVQEALMISNQKWVK